jgi:hypothetical protein
MHSGMAWSGPILVDTITVLFDGTYSVEFGWQRIETERGSYSLNPTPTDYERRYNVVDIFGYESKFVTPEACPMCPGEEWTYTFTNADYEAAVAYNSKE